MFAATDVPEKKSTMTLEKVLLIWRRLNATGVAEAVAQFCSTTFMMFLL